MFMRLLRLRGVWTTNLTRPLLTGFGMFGGFILTPAFVQAPESTGYGFGVDVLGPRRALAHLPRRGHPGPRHRPLLRLGGEPDVDAVPQRQTGEATGMNTFMRTIGGALGAQLSALIVADHIIAGSGGILAESGYVAALVLGAVALTVALLAGG